MHRGWLAVVYHLAKESSLSRDIGALQTTPGEVIGALRPSGTPLIQPAGKASDFAAGLPFLSGGSNAISPGGKPSDFATGLPTVSLGTLTPAGLPSGFAAGLPILNLVQDIGPTGLPSAFAAGLPDLIPAQIVSPTGKTSDFAAGTPTVQGSAQGIRARGLPSAFQAGFPVLSGGAGGVKILIGGVDYSAYLSRSGVANPGQSSTSVAQPLQISSQTLGRWTAIFDLIDVTLTTYPVIDQTVVVMENGVRLFSGGLVQVAVDRFDMGTAMQSYHCTAQDWSAICDRRVVNAIYLAGTDAAYAVRDIWTNVLSNPNEGITANHVASAIDTLDSNEVFSFVTVTQAFDQLATDTGCVWWVDEYADLHFIALANLPACPYSLTETSVNFRALSATATLLDYRNVQYVKSNVAAVPGVAEQQSGGLSPGDPGYGGPVVTETYTLPQAAATARGFVLGACVTNFPILEIVSLKVNGVTQPTYLGTQNLNFQQAWWYFAGFPYLYAPDSANSAPSLPAPPVTSPYPMAGDAVEIKYIAVATSQSAVVNNTGTPLSPSLPGAAGTWGSGVFENVAQVQNVNLQADLNAIAQALLNRSGAVPIVVQFETDEQGARVGQQLTVNLPPSFLTTSDKFLITSIQGTLQSGTLAFGSAMRWTIQATTGQDLGNSTKWFERLIARTENPLPVQQFDQVDFVLAPGGSLSSGIPVGYAYPAKTSGPLVLVSVIAGTPPTDQNLVIDILDGGVSILGIANRIVIPAGNGNEITSTVFASVGQSIGIGDLLTCSVSYSVTGSSPLPASNVLVTVRWSTAGLPQGQTQPGVYASYISGALSVTTTALAAATESVAYSASLVATGGTPPYTWTASGLPAGLTCSATGLVSGTPTVNGNFTIGVTAKDASSPQQTATGVVTLTVNP